MQTSTTDDTDRLGGRLPLLDPATLDPDQRQVYEALTRIVGPESAESGFTAILDDGRLVGPFNAMLRIPEIATGFGQWTSRIAQSGMAAEVRQVVILTVGAAWSAAYEIDAHTSAARAVGVPDQAITAIVAGNPPEGVSSEAAVAYRLTAGLLHSRVVADELYREAIATFGEAGLIAILCLIGQYQTVSSFLVSFQVPVPGHPTTSPSAAAGSDVPATTSDTNGAL